MISDYCLGCKKEEFCRHAKIAFIDKCDEREPKEVINMEKKDNGIIKLHN